MEESSTNAALDLRPPELRAPPWSEMVSWRLLIPFLFYLAFFALLSAVVRRTTFQGYVGFRQYRLHNLTICVVHSAIAGSWCLVFWAGHVEEMFKDVIHWYSVTAAQLPILSIAYFVHDAGHMLLHEWSPWTLELLCHHVVTVFSLQGGLLAEKFLLATYWALLMEVNSVFLHLRTIIQLTGRAKSNPRLYSLVVHLNIITFVIFRFVAQLRFAKWMWDHRTEMHSYYFGNGFFGEIFFTAINGLLFVRVLAADGFLGEKFKARGDRDAPRDGEEKNKHE